MQIILFFSFIILHSFTALAADHYAIVGDAGRWNENNQQIQKSILQNKITKLIMPGDNLYDLDVGYEKTWAPWKAKNFSFDIVAIGNHNDGYEKEMAYFSMPKEYFAKSISKDTKFLVLNSDNKKNVSEQMQWLEDELKNSSEKFLFLVFHHPSLTISSMHKWEEREIFQRSLRILLKKYRSKITALLLGHDHTATLLHFDDLPVYISGATQDLRKPEWIKNEQEGIKVQTNFLYDGTPHWLDFVVDEKAGVAKINFIRAKNNAKICSTTVRTGEQAKLANNCHRR